MNLLESILSILVLVCFLVEVTYKPRIFINKQGDIFLKYYNEKVEKIEYKQLIKRNDNKKF